MKTLIFFFCFVTITAWYSCKQHPKANTITAPKEKKDTIEKAVALNKTLISEPGFKALVDELNYYLVANDTVLAFGNYDPHTFKLTKAEIDSLLKDNDNEQKGKVTGSTLNVYLQGYADSLLDLVLNNKAIVKYNLQDILKLSVAASPDKRVYSISYDANAGGTYKNRISLLHYQAPDGSLHNYSSDNFKPDGFDVIDTIHTLKGIKYLLSGSVTGCMTCIGEYMQLVHFEKDGPVVDFSYSINRRTSDDDQTSITYDNVKKVIEVTHNPLNDDTDLIECDCNTDEARAALSGAIDDNKAKSIDASTKLKTAATLRCILRFNGSTFVLDRKNSRMHNLDFEISLQPIKLTRS